MFLKLDHHKMDIYSLSRLLVKYCYVVTRKFPGEEKFGIVSQIRRAAVSVHLNISEGCSRRSVQERRRFFEVARGSAIEVDTAFQIAVDLEYTGKEELKELGLCLVRCFSMLCKLIGPPD
jgi:four helix bundle protein